MADGLALRTGQDDGTEGSRKDTIERDERRLAELGRRTVEMLAIAHVFGEKLEVGKAVRIGQQAPAGVVVTTAYGTVVRGPALAA
jgi:hypothetical protein